MDKPIKRRESVLRAYMVRIKFQDEGRVREKLKGSPYYLKRTSKGGNLTRMCYFLYNTNSLNRRLCTPNETVRLMLLLGLRSPKNVKDRQFLKAFENNSTRYNKEININQ